MVGLGVFSQQIMMSGDKLSTIGIPRRFLFYGQLSTKILDRATVSGELVFGNTVVNEILSDQREHQITKVGSHQS